jgi:DNA-binding MarR family transcriptional regulator
MGAHISGSDGSQAHDTRKVLDAIRRIVHALRESSRWAEKHVGVSGAQLFVLQKLAESPALSLNDLAARTHTHQSSVSTVVTRLVEGGFVRRSKSSKDRRNIELSLAARGRQLVGRAPDAAQDRLIRGIEQLPRGRRRMLASTLGELAELMDQVNRTPAMFFEERTSRRKERPRG